MKITNKTLLIGFLFGIIFFCIFRDNSFREGLGETRRAKKKKEKKEKENSFIGKVAGGVAGVGSFATNTMVNTAIGAAAAAGKVKNVTNIMGNVFNKEASNGEK